MTKFIFPLYYVLAEMQTVLWFYFYHFLGLTVLFWCTSGLFVDSEMSVGKMCALAKGGKIEIHG